MTIITKIKFYHALIALTSCSLAFIYLIVRPVNHSRRFLSDSSCDGPVKKCPEGEEAYFRAYPDVEKKWKLRTAYYHWKRYEKFEGRTYICKCDKSGDGNEFILFLFISIPDCSWSYFLVLLCV